MGPREKCRKRRKKNKHEEKEGIDGAVRKNMSGVFFTTFHRVYVLLHQAGRISKMLQVSQVQISMQLGLSSSSYSSWIYHCPFGPAQF